MNAFLGCIKKDRLEFLRSFKSLICIIVLLSAGSMVLAATAALPALLEKVMSSASVFSEGSSLFEFMNKFFPSDLKSSMGIFSSDVGVFYGFIAIFFSYSTIPDDIHSGRIIIPLCCGHSLRSYVLSKEIVYSSLICIPVFVAYMLYYLAGSAILENNYAIETAIINGLVLSFSIFAITVITMALSMIFKNRFSVLALMIGIILVVPDALSFFTFGRFFPTYLLTYTYTSSSDYPSLVIPLLLAIGAIILLNTYAILVRLRIDIDDRR